MVCHLREYFITFLGAERKQGEDGAQVGEFDSSFHILGNGQCGAVIPRAGDQGGIDPWAWSRWAKWS